MGTYVVGDIHGQYSRWIEFHNMILEQDSDATFIFVGDLIDRGPETCKMLDWAMENITDGGKYQTVIGNHEAEKIDWWDNRFEPAMQRCIKKGRQINLDIIATDRYSFSLQFRNCNKTYKDLESAINWFRTLPYYKDITVGNNRFIIVHADIPRSAVSKDKTHIKENLDDYTKEMMLWNRNTDDFTKMEGVTLVHGHTPTIIKEKWTNRRKPIQGKIKYTLHRYNVDCGITYKDKVKEANLAALRLEDLKEFYLYN